jgi:hypothetical protein
MYGQTDFQTGQTAQTAQTTTNYTTQQYQYQYQLPTTTQTTTTTEKYQYQYQIPTQTTQTTTTQQYQYQIPTQTTQTTTTQQYQFDIPTTSTTTQQYQYNLPTTTTQQFISQPVTTTTISQPVTYTQQFTTQPVTYTTTATTVPGLVPGLMKPQPAFRLLRQGAGISPNEQQGIVSTAMAVYQSGITPISNNTASRIKKTLGGDWIVIVYAQGKPVDFNMTCVQGNDYMYFTLDNTAYQVCRLR